jgi:hypothetical protein
MSDQQNPQLDSNRQGFNQLPEVGPKLNDPLARYDGQAFLTHRALDPVYIKRFVDQPTTVFSSQGLVTITNPIPLQPNPYIPTLPIQ